MESLTPTLSIATTLPAPTPSAETPMAVTPQKARKAPEAQPHPEFAKIQTNDDLAMILGWKTTRSLTLLGKSKSDHYSILFLRKKGGSGKLRTLHNPDSLLRAVQYRILTRLLDKVTVPQYIHAFEKNKSVPAMAQVHVNKQAVISLDLKDFFPSIDQVMLYHLFQGLGMGASAARTMSELCTFKAFVPQGALTSPKVSNLIAATTFGPPVEKYCLDRGLTLSIYADDITISSDVELVTGDGEGSPYCAKTIIEDIGNIVREFGFSINRQKTKVMKRSHRQYVCGAVVNTKVNLQRRQRNKLRAMVHNVVTNGVQAEAAKTGQEPSTFLSKLMGSTNWFAQLNPQAGGVLKERLQGAVTQFMAQQREATQEEVVPTSIVVAAHEAPQELGVNPAPW
jgi:RNA-directed DNA polymerase